MMIRKSLEPFSKIKSSLLMGIVAAMLAISITPAVRALPGAACDMAYWNSVDDCRLESGHSVSDCIQGVQHNYYACKFEAWLDFCSKNPSKCNHAVSIPRLNLALEGRSFDPHGVLTLSAGRWNGKSFEESLGEVNRANFYAAAIDSLHSTGGFASAKWIFLGEGSPNVKTGLWDLDWVPQEFVDVNDAVDGIVFAVEFLDSSIPLIPSVNTEPGVIDGVGVMFQKEKAFIRGDTDASGQVDITDCIRILSYLYLGGEEPPCLRGADLGGDGAIDIGDPIALLNTLFMGKPSIVAPYPACGVAPDIGDLGCQAYSPCDSFIAPPPGPLYLALDQPSAITYETPLPVDDFVVQRRTILVFAGGADGHLYSNGWVSYPQAGWHWVDHGTPSAGVTVSSPKGVTFDGKIYVFCPGSDGHLYVRYSVSDQWRWADQGVPSGATVGQRPAVITYRQGDLQVIYAFLRGSNGHLYVNFWDGSRWQWADQGTPLGGFGASSLPEAIEVFDPLAKVHRIYVFTGAGNGHLVVNFWNGAFWQWVDQGSPPGSTELPGKPSAITYTPDYVPFIYVFVNESRTGSLWVNYWTGSIWRWADQGAMPVGQRATSWPAATTYWEASSRKISVFDPGAGSEADSGRFNHLNVNYWSGTAWSWADQGALPNRQTMAAPDAISFLAGSGVNSIQCFVIGSSGRLYTNTWNGSVWSWMNLGPRP